jgi:hypothetical protein
MIGRPTCRLGHDTVEPELTQVDRLHEGVDHADGIVLVDPVIQALGKQRRLPPIQTFNKTPHPIPPQPSRNLTILPRFYTARVQEQRSERPFVSFRCAIRKRKSRTSPWNVLGLRMSRPGRRHSHGAVARPPLPPG